MKFIISENRLVSMVFKYLDNQDFIIKKQKQENTIFLDSENDELAVLVFSKKLNKVGIADQFLKEIKSFFSLRNREAEKLIGEWVCKKIGIDKASTIVLPIIVVNPYDEE